jgi:DEAD/DEAH box helicase domain-containing protein
VPVDPSTVPASRFAESPETARMPVPDSQDRQTIDAVLAEITEQEWYKGEIAARRVFEAKAGQTGGNCAW